MADAADIRRRALELMGEDAPERSEAADIRRRARELMGVPEELEAEGAPGGPALAATSVWDFLQKVTPGLSQAMKTLGTVGKVAASHPGRKLLGALGVTLDAPRHFESFVGYELGTGAYSLYDWTQGLFGGLTEKQIRGSMATGKIGWREAWRATETGGRIIEHLAPQYAKRNPWKTKWLWGLGYEIITDPLNVMSFFSLTKTGRALEGTARLARTLKGQAAAGQRALVQITPGGPLVWIARRLMPKAVKYGALPRKVALAGPRVVGLVGAAGRWIRHPLRMARGQGAVIDAIRFAQDVAAPRVAGEAGMEFLKINDALAGLQKSVDPDTWLQAMRAGEHLGKHPLEFAQYSDDAKRLAQHAYALVGQQKAIAVKYGIIGPEATELANFHRAIAMLETARGKEVRRLAKELMPHVGAQEAKSLQTLSVQQGIANEINDELVELADKLYDDGLNFIGTAKDLDTMRELNRAATKAQKQLASSRYRALQLAEWKSAVKQGKLGEGVPLTKKIEKYGRDIQKVEKAMGNQPNWMPHVLTEWGLRKVTTRGGFGRNLERRMWSDQYNGFIQRRFVEDVVLESKSIVRAGRRVPVKVKRWLALDEIDKILQNPKIGTKAEWYATELAPHIKEQGGVWGAIERRFHKVLEPSKRLGRFFKLDPTKAFEHTNRQILYAIRGKAFLQSVLGETVDLVAPAAKSPRGWWKLRQVSAALANAYGDVAIHPELGMELSRVYKQMFRPESFNTALRYFDKATRLFKRSVTGAWPSYQFRNQYSDMTLMLYNGDMSPVQIGIDGAKGYYKRGTIATSLYGDIPAEELNRAARSYGVLFGEQVEAGARGLTTMPENIRRMGYFADRLKRGRSFFQASMDTKKVLFDYAQMSDFERNYLRRVIPFWSWLRNNVRRQVAQLATDPAIVAHQMRLSQRTEVVAGVDSWVRGRGMIAMDPDKQTGEERLLVGLDFPMTDIVQLLDADGGWQQWLEKASFRLNPLVKLGFAGREFIRGTGYFERPKVTSAWVKSLPESAKKLMGVRRELGRYGEYWTISPRYDYLLKNMPSARFYSTARVLAKKETLPDWRFLGIGRKGWGLLTGIREHRYRPWEVAERKRRAEAEKKLGDLQRAGEIGTFQRPYRRPGADISPAEFSRIQRAAERR